MVSLRRDSAAPWIVGIAAALVVVAAGLFYFSLAQKTKVQLGDKVIQARIADSYKERQQGLSGTTELGSDEGLLFVFGKVEKHEFWMKDMHYDIDIIWIDTDKKVVDITPNLSPDTYPKTFAPKKPVKYVVEVPAGFAKRHNVYEGSSVYFTLPR